MRDGEGRGGARDGEERGGARDGEERGGESEGVEQGIGDRVYYTVQIMINIIFITQTKV